MGAVKYVDPRRPASASSDRVRALRKLWTHLRILHTDEAVCIDYDV